MTAHTDLPSTSDSQFSSHFCQHLYDMAREQPGRNELTPQPDGRRLLVVQNFEDADIVLRRNVDNYAKNYRWFSQVAGNSRFTDEGAQWKFRQELSQPYLGKFDADRAFHISTRQATRMADHFAAKPPQDVLDEALIHQNMLSIFTQMFLEVEVGSIPMAHDSASRLTELASLWAFVEPGSNAISHSKELIREILQLRKQVFTALQTLRSEELQGSPMLRKMLEAESAPGFDFSFEKELTMMLGAGTDTASYSIGWALHLLASHPQLQERLFAGISAIHAEHQSDPQALKTAIAEHGDLRCLISELLRLYPTAPFVPRIAQGDDQLSDMQVKAGDVIVVSLIGVNEKALQRTNPWEPDLDAAAREGFGMGSGMISSFVWGKRICGGRSFALVELASVLSVLIRKLHFELSSNDPIEFEWVGQMRRKGGQRVRVLPR